MSKLEDPMGGELSVGLSLIKQYNVMELIEEAEEGELDEPIATELTGMPPDPSMLPEEMQSPTKFRSMNSDVSSPGRRRGSKRRTSTKEGFMVEKKKPTTSKSKGKKKQKTARSPTKKKKKDLSTKKLAEQTSNYELSSTTSLV
mmetsp:Transcript_17002/g.26211  ORF Transcript_17002/g.26211 Transcript_17002/m.26211 type:complete len:144 (+) Transcript_17002:2026-2457(+)